MKMCKVPRKSLRRWSHVGCLRKKGCGRKTKNPKMEEQLVQWYNEVKKRNVNVTAKMIREKAVEISNDKDFLASKGWLEKFKKKNGIQIVNNKRRRNDSLETENNNTMNDNTNKYCYRNNKEKELDKDDYEINIINDNYKRKGYKEEKKANISLNNELSGDKENTNSNIINNSESQK